MGLGWASGAPGPEGWAGVVSMKRHAQVRRATYTYGVIPQDIQLLHQLRDQDVLGGRQRDMAVCEWQLGGPGKVKEGRLTVTPSASQYTCRGLFPSTKGVWWKLMAGDFLSLS